MAENEFKIDTFRTDADDGLRAAMENYICSHFEADHAEIKSLSQPDTGGMSASSFLLSVELTTAEAVESRGLVVRRSPEKDSFFQADVSAWGRAMQAVAEGTDLPVPKVHAIEPGRSLLGAPFILMDRHEGRVPSDMPPYRLGGWVKDERSSADRSEMWDDAIRVTGAIHAFDWEGAGLSVISRSHQGSSEVQGELDYYIEALDWGLQEKRTPFMDDVVDWLQANVPSSERHALCWGDARPGNMMFHSNRVTAILDWEMVSIGDPSKDLGWWIFSDSIFDAMLDVELPRGCLTGAPLVERYQTLCETEIRDLEFYIAFAGFKTVALYARAHSLQTEAGVPIPETMSLENAPNIKALRSFLEKV